MEAYEWLQKADVEQFSVDGTAGSNAELDDKVVKLLDTFETFMNDDFGTARVLASMFELVPIINGFKDKTVAAGALSRQTANLLQQKMKTWVEDIFGLLPETAAAGNDKLQGVMQVLINIRKEARAKKDWATSDAIRNQLATLGIQLKDEKDGNMSWTLVS